MEMLSQIEAGASEAFSFISFFSLHCTSRQSEENKKQPRSDREARESEGGREIFSNGCVHNAEVRGTDVGKVVQ